MKFNVYAIYNSMSELFYSEGLFVFNTDAHCQHIMATRIPDSDKTFNQIICVGSIDVVTGVITPCPHRPVDWKVSASPVDALPMNKSSISHEPANVQESKFQESISDIKG